jgi:hypothetical protein
MFPGDVTWTDVSHLVVNGSQEEDLRMMNEERRSVVDSYSFMLLHDQDITDAFANASAKIFCTVDEYGGARVFTGWIAPTDAFTIGQGKTSRIGPRRVDAYDMSYLLDEPLAESIQYPALVTDSGWKIFDSANPSTSIVHQLLTVAGYNTATDIDPGCPEVLITVDSVTGEKGSETPREILDTLLSEHGYVLTYTAGGQFSLHQWDRDTVVSSATISFVGIQSGLHVSKLEREYDGVELTWAELDVMQDALLYRHNLPISTTAGELGFPGEPIAAGDYFPADSDIEDIYQRFREKWLDVPYLARDTRLRNRDLSLVNTSGHHVEFTADAGVAVSTEEYEPTRSRVNFYNGSGATASIYTWDILGDALYRSAIRKTTVPSTATNPEKRTTRFVFNDARATRLATARSRVLRFGNYRYEFEDRVDYSPGDIVTIHQEHPDFTTLDTTVVILSRRKNPQRPMRRYQAQAITAYSAEAALKVGIGVPSEAAREALSEAVRTTTPTFDDLDNGYTAPSGGTTTPSKPTLVGVGGFQYTRLAWDRQKSLTNFQRYEIQVSPDSGTTWYYPDDGGTGLGAQDPGDDSVYREWYVEEFVHGKLPLDGTTDDPQDKPFTYRTRRVTSDLDRSAWSDPVTVYAGSVPDGSLGANIVHANNIVAAALQALFAKISYQLTIGYYGTGTESSPQEGDVRIYLDGDEIRYEIYTNSAWSTERRIRIGGADANGNFIPFLSCGGLLSDLDDAPTDDPVPADSSLRLFKFDGNMQDQDGVDPWTINLGTAGYNSALEWEGTHCLAPVDSLLNAQYSNGWTVGSDATVAFRLRVDDSDITNSGLVLLHDYVLYNDYITIRYEYYNGGHRIEVTVSKSGTVTTFRSQILSKSVWHFVGFFYNSTSNLAYLRVDDQVFSATPSGAWGSAVSAPVFLELVGGTFGGSTYERYMDDLLISPSYATTADRLRQHYERGRPWTAEYAIEDVLLVPESGGVVRIADTAGALHPMQTWVADRGSDGDGTYLEFANGDKVYIGGGGGETLYTIYGSSVSSGEIFDAFSSAVPLVGDKAFASGGVEDLVVGWVERDTVTSLVFYGWEHSGLGPAIKTLTFWHGSGGNNHAALAVYA